MAEACGLRGRAQSQSRTLASERQQDAIVSLSYSSEKYIVISVRYSDEGREFEPRNASPRSPAFSE